MENVTNYITFHASKRENTKEEICIFTAGHSGTDLAAENHPERACEVKREAAFDTN